MRIFILDKSYTGGNSYQLKKRDTNYIINVLRLKDGSVFTVRDVDNNYYKATLRDQYLELEETDNPEESLLDHFSSFNGEFFPITVYQALCKGKKNEQIVRCLTEAGVKEICFITSDYTQEHELKPHDKERLEVICKEAIQQSGSRFNTKLSGPISFKEAVKQAEGTKVILHQSQLENTSTLTNAIKDATSISLFVGSEGGFSDEECLYFEENNGIAVLLKTNILRAETAGIYTVGALQNLLN